MIAYVLDTDTVSLLQHGHAALSQRVQQHAPATLGVAIVTVEEQLQGRLAVIRRGRTHGELTRSYQRLGEAIAFFSRITVLPYSESAGGWCDRWRAQGVRIGTQDLRIAAIAHATGATVVTRNRRDFDRIPDLRSEDWS